MRKEVPEEVLGSEDRDLAPEEESRSTHTTDELDRLEQELEATRDQLVRTLADFDNYRRRIEREAETIGQAGKRDLILGLLDVLDSFDQAYDLLSNEANKEEGLSAIHRQLMRLLEAHGVRPFHSLGEPFDPMYHEAVSIVAAKDEGSPSGLILKEYQKGYLWGDRLLRPARVQVAQQDSEVSDASRPS